MLFLKEPCKCEMVERAFTTQPFSHGRIVGGAAAAPIIPINLATRVERSRDSKALMRQTILQVVHAKLQQFPYNSKSTLKALQN